MHEKLLRFFNRGITTSFFLLFFLTPLTFVSFTSELFEFNKMWMVFFLTVLIAGFWVGKMAITQTIRVQRTLLDIPILLFLISQVISTIFSLDTHISLWGYYSRFNGGLLSILAYIFLYYAFASNYYDRALEIIRKMLWASLLSGGAVALWGFPSHFGYDPTCLLFRGTFDVSCWTEAFQPKIRIFSTLGQPNWLAAYLSILLPIALAFILEMVRTTKEWSGKQKFRLGFLITLSTLFYLDLLFTGSQSGFLGCVSGILLFMGFLVHDLFKTKKGKFFTAIKSTTPGRFGTAVVIAALLLSFFAGTPIAQLNRFTFTQIKSHLTPAPKTTAAKPATPPPAPAFAGELGGTDSSKIRLIVWRGALEVFRHNPLFGTGVETFAYAYYKHRPTEHNLTSEWDFLYNKAHNEYLNYLATTGAFGLLTYLSIIVLFLFQTGKKLLNSSLKTENFELQIALAAAYVSILVSNFFGFSVVMIQVYFFLIPVFLLFLQRIVVPTKQLVLGFGKPDAIRVSKVQWAYLGITTLLSVFAILTLYRFWIADTNYAMGYNLDRAGQYQNAYGYLHQAVAARPSEPVFQDELTYNDAVLSLSFATQKDATSAAALAQESTRISNQLTLEHPNSITFWKTRVRDFYLFSQVDPGYLPLALIAIQKAAELAPTDAKVSYNLGILLAQNEKLEKATNVLEKTIKLKPDYRDAYYALGLFYHDSAVDKNGRVTDPEKEQKAVKTLHYILDNFDANDQQVLQALSSWGEK